jgi:hypothetical protein
MICDHLRGTPLSYWLALQNFQVLRQAGPSGAARFFACYPFSREYAKTPIQEMTLAEVADAMRLYSSDPEAL